MNKKSHSPKTSHVYNIYAVFAAGDLCFVVFLFIWGRFRSGISMNYRYYLFFFIHNKTTVMNYDSVFNLND